MYLKHHDGICTCSYNSSTPKNFLTIFEIFENKNIQILLASYYNMVYIYTCTKPDIMVLVIPPEAAANTITNAIRPTAACAVLSKIKYLHLAMTS